MSIEWKYFSRYYFIITDIITEKITRKSLSVIIFMFSRILMRPSVNLFGFSLCHFLRIRMLSLLGIVKQVCDVVVLI